MPPRIPTEADFAPLSRTLPHSLHWPSPRESTVAILILFHGLGDSEVPFANFARSLSLPGVLAIAVRGPNPVPGALLGLPDGSASGSGSGHYHWGDDLRLDPDSDDLDADPGFERAAGLLMDRLVRETLLERCGWETSDILLFGFGQGGSLALGLAARLAGPRRVVDVTEGQDEGDPEVGVAFKGVVSIGGPLPPSLVSTVSGRGKSRTPVLLCQIWDDEAVDYVKTEFADVTNARWKRRDVAMPRDREEALPMMRFFAERLRSGW